MDAVDAYIKKKSQWSEGLQLLRKWLSDSPLEETIKWGAPTYTYEGKNLIGIGAFNNYFGLWFFQGVFLKDEANLLVNAQENKTKALRQMRFESTEDLDEEIIRAYIRESIENQKAGKVLQVKRQKLVVPEILSKALQNDQALNKAYNQLLPGKQKEYANYIKEAKKDSTKANRLQKIIPLIKAGRGLNDQYK